MGLGLFCKNPNGCTHRNLVFSEENELVLGNQHVPYIEAFDGSAEVVIEFAAYVDILFFKGTRNVPLMKVLPRSFPFHYIVDNVEEITKDWKPQLSPTFLYESTFLIEQFTKDLKAIENWMSGKGVFRKIRDSFGLIWKVIKNPLTVFSNTRDTHIIIQMYQTYPESFRKIFGWFYGFKVCWRQASGENIV
eukprot:TRINITY_DN392_c0_g1_i1.p1 TRINITY_DN392_c0_g1~~TRINITY_DN392_c0_g1_i1.p1  ORF type:complete len:191 (+),score=18.66 TRINITY_DN392_c0_g1_i1:109-681(+)